MRGGRSPVFEPPGPTGFINTLLQLGASKPVEFQPFQRFWTMETAEAVQDSGAPDHTPLKQGVNGSSINTLFGSPAAISKKWDAPVAQAVCGSSPHSSLPVSRS